ncbi:MAG: FAD-dependent thymidylate synthase [Prevotellaceae bacterium]|jgi:thymidylate synthase ThyX|nr:FAD-dependent thymidylate synthase [Prevotellaceae bacterium]
MMDKDNDFIVESFSEAEVVVLNRYFTNVDKPVFGLRNLPETVKGALFARYSRSGKSLRRLFLDEFYDEELYAGDFSGNAGLRRASSLYDKMILDFGDDSVAQLGGAHLACEQASNVLTKVLERGRLASYLEQSTRYIYFNEKTGGRYRYAVPGEVRGTGFESVFRKGMDALFDAYSEILNGLVPRLNASFRREGASDRAREATVKAKACDMIRGLLPAATRSNLGIYADGQSFENLLVRMYASDSAETAAFADMMLEELRKLVPSFLARVDLDDRGRLHSRYLRDTARNTADCASRILRGAPNGDRAPRRTNNEVALTDFDPAALDKTLQAILFESSEASRDAIDRQIASMSESEKTALLEQYCGERANRRHRPGRAFEMPVYRFEILSDYGAFRDLQRHRILTIIWQKLSTRNGYVTPDELDEHPEQKSIYEKALVAAAEVYEALRSEFGEDAAQYAVPFAYRLRYEITMNLREAFHFIELRSQKQGHDSYRKISVEMCDLIERKAGHGFFTELMNFVDRNTYGFAREDAEAKRDRRTTHNNNNR